ncbi:hypothetical protein JB92DRAFT_2832786 [Gautieria morchelliformis]|nr:hypothetical protein JB92DRAFT_2832786 [Gautieria morchelliformis]
MTLRRLVAALTRKMHQPSDSNANTVVREDPKALGFLAPPGVFPVLKRKKRLTDERSVVSRTPGDSALIGKSSDLLPVPPLPPHQAKGAAACPSTITLTRSPFISDYDAEETVRRSDKKTGKVREDPKTLGFLAPPGAFPVLKRKKLKRFLGRHVLHEWSRYPLWILFQFQLYLVLFHS